jgi:hypothetical protein
MEFPFIMNRILRFPITICSHNQIKGQEEARLWNDFGLGNTWTKDDQWWHGKTSLQPETMVAHQGRTLDPTCALVEKRGLLAPALSTLQWPLEVTWSTPKSGRFGCRCSAYTRIYIYIDIIYSYLIYNIYDVHIIFIPHIQCTYAYHMLAPRQWHVVFSTCVLYKVRIRRVQCLYRYIHAI